MIPVAQYARVGSKLVADNAPTILSALAVAGVVSTTVFAVRATPEALRRIDDASRSYGDDYVEYVKLAKLDVVKVAWKPYIPALIMGCGTMACIVGANSIGTRRSAALLSAVTLGDTAFKEYRAKVVETLGEAKEQHVRDEVMQERVNKNPVDNEVILVGSGEVLCYDALSDRYFRSDHETIRRAQNDINSQILQEDYASLNEFYSKIGLRGTTLGEELGWRPEGLLEVRFTTTMSEDNRPCLAINYDNLPIRNYWKHG